MASPERDRGHHRVIGGRRTYFPPFIDERFYGKATFPKDKQFFWSCTFAALLNTANVGFLGSKINSHAEVQRLADASGDTTLSGGANTDQMLTAFRNRYGLPLDVDPVDRNEARRRLATGYALVVGIIPAKFDPAFYVGITAKTGGHRITLLGMNGARTATRILDPMVPAVPGYEGRWIPWSVVEKAQMKATQVWIREGQFLATKPIVITQFRPSRRFGVAAGTTVVAFDPDSPTAVADRQLFGEASGARFDALVKVQQADGTSVGPFLRVVSGRFQGLLIKRDAKGITSTTTPDAPGHAPAGAGLVGPPALAVTPSQARLEIPAGTALLRPRDEGPDRDAGHAAPRRRLALRERSVPRRHDERARTAGARLRANGGRRRDPWLTQALPSSRAARRRFGAWQRQPSVRIARRSSRSISGSRTRTAGNPA